MSDMGKDIKPRTQNKNHQTIKQKPLYSRAKNTNKETKENKNEEINTRENYHETSTDYKPTTTQRPAGGKPNKLQERVPAVWKHFISKIHSQDNKKVENNGRRYIKTMQKTTKSPRHSELSPSIFIWNRWKEKNTKTDKNGQQKPNPTLHETNDPKQTLQPKHIQHRKFTIQRQHRSSQ
jgi:hypothetical protein